MFIYFRSQKELDEEDIPPSDGILQSKRVSEGNLPLNDESFDPRPLTDLEKPFEKVSINETFEEKENTNPSNDSLIHVERVSLEDIEKKPVETINEILPPLSSTSMAQEFLQDHRIEPIDLPSNEEEKIHDDEEYPFEDILSNKTLLKKVFSSDLNEEKIVR